MDLERWLFDESRLANSPSRQHGIEAEKELGYLQQVANFIQDIGRKLSLPLLCINTAVLFTQRFYVFHSLTVFEKFSLGAAALFLAAKVEEHPRKVEHVSKAARLIMNRDISDAEYVQDLLFNEHALLQTLGFELQVQHPHQHVLRLCDLVKLSKDMSQFSYILATYCLHLTKMCLIHKPTIIACVCIHTACKVLHWTIPVKEGKAWFLYLDGNTCFDMLDRLSNEFLLLLQKCPTKYINRNLNAYHEKLLQTLKSNPATLPVIKDTITSSRVSSAPTTPLANESIDLDQSIEGLAARTALNEEINIFTASFNKELTSRITSDAEDWSLCFDSTVPAAYLSEPSTSLQPPIIPPTNHHHSLSVPQNQNVSTPQTMHKEWGHSLLGKSQSKSSESALTLTSTKTESANSYCEKKTKQNTDDLIRKEILPKTSSLDFSNTHLNILTKPDSRRDSSIMHLSKTVHGLTSTAPQQSASNSNRSLLKKPEHTLPHLTVPVPGDQKNPSTIPPRIGPLRPSNKAAQLGNVSGSTVSISSKQGSTDSPDSALHRVSSGTPTVSSKIFRSASTPLSSAGIPSIVNVTGYTINSKAKPGSAEPPESALLRVSSVPQDITSKIYRSGSAPTSTGTIRGSSSLISPRVSTKLPLPSNEVHFHSPHSSGVTRASDGASQLSTGFSKNVSLMTIESPKVKYGGSSINVGTPNVTPSGSSLHVEAPKVKTSGSSMNVESPKLKLSGSSMIVETPKVKSSGSTINVETPKGKTSGSFIAVESPKVKPSGSTINIDTLKVISRGSSLNLETSKLKSSGPSMIAETPKVKSSHRRDETVPDTTKGSTQSQGSSGSLKISLSKHPKGWNVAHKRDKAKKVQPSPDKDWSNIGSLKISIPKSKIMAPHPWVSAPPRPATPADVNAGQTQMPSAASFSPDTPPLKKFKHN